MELKLFPKKNYNIAAHLQMGGTEKKTLKKIIVEEKSKVKVFSHKAIYEFKLPPLKIFNFYFRFLDSIRRTKNDLLVLIDSSLLAPPILYNYKNTNKKLFSPLDDLYEIYTNNSEEKDMIIAYYNMISAHFNKYINLFTNLCKKFNFCYLLEKEKNTFLEILENRLNYYLKTYPKDKDIKKRPLRKSLRKIREKRQILDLHKAFFRSLYEKTRNLMEILKENEKKLGNIFENRNTDSLYLSLENLCKERAAEINKKRVAKEIEEKISEEDCFLATNFFYLSKFKPIVLLTKDVDLIELGTSLAKDPSTLVDSELLKNEAYLIFNCYENSCNNEKILSTVNVLKFRKA